MPRSQLVDQWKQWSRKTAGRASRRKPRQARLALEALEQRVLMTASPGPLADHVGVVRDGHTWYLSPEVTGTGTQETRGYGLPNDQFLTGDWNVDGAQDLVVVRVNAQGGLTWLIDLGSDNIPDLQHNYGLAGDTAVLGDWNGDGIDDPGVVRGNPAAGRLDWYLDTSRVENANPTPRAYGLTSRGDRPVVGDWNGDGRDDVGVVANGPGGLLTWYLDTNGDSFQDITRGFGLVSQAPTAVVGDWNADGRDDLGVAVVSNGGITWLLDTSGDQFADITKAYGLAADRPVVVNRTNSVSGHDRDDQMTEATALGALNGTISEIGNISFSTDVDMLSFTVTAGQTVSFDIDTPTNGPPGLGSYLRVFDAQGNELAANNDRVAPGDPLPPSDDPDGFDSYIPFTFTRGGTYYVGVSNWQHRSYNPATGADALGADPKWLTGVYTLVITASTLDDRYEENDSIAAAANLGLLTTTQSYALSLQDGIDWFRFSIGSGGTSASTITTQFRHSQGDIDIDLYDANGNLVRRSNGVTDSETISMDRLARGTYFLRVYGYNGARNPSYTLTLRPPGTTPVADKQLYVNFDGAALSNAQLRQWAHGQWQPSNVDPEGDGIQVRPFLQGQRLNGQREAIISQIMTMVQTDLTPYGIQVLRHSGGAIDGRGVTTIFVGANPGLGHVAGDIDYGNDNLTDIAFVTNENWGTASRTAMALADTVLHEAGHTFGLHHVNTNVNGRIYHESMGFRYSQPDQTQWVQNTAFLDRTFAPIPGHGPTSQNSHQTMLRNFSMSPAVAQNKIATVSFAISGIVEIAGSANADQITVSRDGIALELTVNGQKYALDSSIRSVVVRTNGDARDIVSSTVGDAVRLTKITTTSSATDAGRSKVFSQNTGSWTGFNLPAESHHQHSDSVVEHIALQRVAEPGLFPSENRTQFQSNTVRPTHLAKQIPARNVAPHVEASPSARSIAQASGLNSVVRVRSGSPATADLNSSGLTPRLHDAVFADFPSIYG